MPYYKGSWYSQLPAHGWIDREDRPGSAALGVPDWQQGIALPFRNSLGKWFNVTPPGGDLPFPMQQTDLGPAKWTGRGVDISAAAAHQMGYTPKNFPTDAQWKIEPRDEPRGLGSPAGMPVQAGDLPDNTDDTPYAPGPGTGRREQQGPKMPTSLMDMFRPSSAAGEPVDFGRALQSRSNSLIGLGLGLMSAPGMGAALEGYQRGAGQDAAMAARDLAMRQHLADQRRAQANTDRSFAEQVRQFNLTAEGGKVPPGWTRGPEGGLAPIPGGPADPKYLQQTTEAKAKPREFSVSDITKLSDEGGKFAQVKGFTETFEPRFAGYKSSTIGDVANLAGRNVPGLVGKDVAEGASWWQGYDAYKNVVRHELYGGALTPSEIQVFEKANVNTGMDPKQIEKNLATQNEVVQNGLKRKANAMIAAGYDPKVISQAYGINLGDIGVTATKRGAEPTPTAPSPAVPGTTGDPLTEARHAIRMGASRDAVLKRLRERGIDPAGL